MKENDPRLTPARPDLAAAHLKGRVHAGRYAEGEPLVCVVGKTWLRRKGEPHAPVDTELLFGETFIAYDRKDGFCWGQSARDGYVGYVAEDHLAAPAAPVTHRIIATSTFLFAQPDLKAAVLQTLPFNAVVTPGDDLYAELPGGGFVFSKHFVPLDHKAPDWVAVAERFIGTPYLWGGRSPLGYDCSALTQSALQAGGIAALRDTDMQEATLGDALPVADDLSGLRRGDLVFWKGHVGVMVDPATLLHANAYHLAVAAEPLAVAAARIAKNGGPITSIRRLQL